MIKSEKQTKIERIIAKECYRTVPRLTLGYMRYEALRRLNPKDYTKLHQRNLLGERFDDLVDDLVVEFYG